MKFSFLEFLNRIGGIFAWVGLWNIIIFYIKEDDLLANLLLFVCGLHVWLVTNEFEPNRVSSR